jgi:hypothetical protein
MLDEQLSRKITSLRDNGDDDDVQMSVHQTRRGLQEHQTLQGQHGHDDNVNYPFAIDREVDDDKTTLFDNETTTSPETTSSDTEEDATQATTGKRALTTRALDSLPTSDQYRTRTTQQRSHRPRPTTISMREDNTRCTQLLQ